MPKEQLFLLVTKQEFYLLPFSLNTSATVRQFMCTPSCQPSADWPICCCYANVRKSVGAIGIWLGISSVREAECDTHLISTLHTRCLSAGDRAHRKLWGEVLFWWTRPTILSCRDLWDYVLKTSKKTKLENRKRSSYFLLSWHSWRQQESYGLSGSYMETRPGLRWAAAAQLLTCTQQVSAGINSTGPGSRQHNPGLALTLILKSYYEVFQDKVWA